MKRTVLRVGAAAGSLTAGAVVRKGQRLGTAWNSLRKFVTSPVDAVIESVIFMRDQQAYLLVLCPLPAGYPVGTAARFAVDSLPKAGPGTA